MNAGKTINSYAIVESERELYEDILDILVHTKNIKVQIVVNGTLTGTFKAKCYNGLNNHLAKFLANLLNWYGVAFTEDWLEDDFYYENLSPLNHENKGETQGKMILTLYLLEKKYGKD